MDQMIKLTKEEITALKHVVQELALRIGEDEIGTFNDDAASSRNLE